MTLHPMPLGAECLDAGLFSPVRAGCPIEAVVSDRAWLQAMLDAEAGLAAAQARLGTLPQSAAKVIADAARADRFDIRALAVTARESANPVVGLVKALAGVVAAVDPGAADYVHRGSTSQDILDTGVMLLSQRALRLIQADLDRCACALALLASRHRDTVMAGRTLALHAVPTTFGLKAAGWRQLVLDAKVRLDGILESGLPISLGGAAGTLAGYLEFARIDGAERQAAAVDYLDRLIDTFAEVTGLARPALPWHALRTPIADLAAALAFTAGALGKIAVDVQSLTRTEVGEVAEPSAPGRGSSSAMPHKRNPVLATLIRSASLQVPVMAAALTQCLVSEDERSAGPWHAEWAFLRECLRLVGGAAHTAAELIEGLQVKPEQMRTNLELTGNQILSERIAAVLAPRLGRATAAQLVSDASATAQRTGRPLNKVLATTPEVSRLLSADELADLCDPVRYSGAAGLLVDQATRLQPLVP